MIESRVETITPELATQYLSRNRKNRTIRKRDVEAYAREIRRGTFQLTHQGIAFDTEDNLIDGQHRLMAIAMAGQPVQMMVTRGIPAATMKSIDRGAGRTMRDVMVLSDSGGADVTRASKNAIMISAMSQLVEHGLKRVNLTTTEIIDLFAAFKDEVDTVFNSAVNKKGIGRSQILSAAIAAMHAGVDKEAIEKFFRVFLRSDIRDCDDYNVQVVLNWRKQIDDAKLQGMAMNKRRVYIGTQNAIHHFVNNTQTTRINANAQLKYDVSATLKSVLGM